MSFLRTGKYAMLVITAMALWMPAACAQPPVAGNYPPKKEHYDNGKLRKEVEVITENKGKKVITTTSTKEFYESGQLKLEETHVATGPWPRKVKLIEYREYHPNGQLKEKGKLKDVIDRKTYNCKRGKVVKYNTDGKPIDIAVYSRGKCKK